MKRILAALLAALLLFGLFGCHDTTGQAPEETAPVVEATPAPTDTPAPTEAPTPTPEPTPEPTKSPAELWKELDAQFPALRSSYAATSLENCIWDPSAFGLDKTSLPMYSNGTIEDRIRYYTSLKQLLERMEAFDAEALDEKDRFAYDTALQELKARVSCSDYILCEDPFLPTVGNHDSLLSLMTVPDLRSADDAEWFLTVLESMPAFLDKLIAREKSRVMNGMFMTEYALDRTLKEIDEVRKSGKDFFAYRSLGTAMDALGMTEEEQAPYLARSEAAVDDILAAYDRLYTELAALRSNCENPDTPYADPSAAQSTEWYRYFSARLTELSGTENPATCETALAAYDAVLQYMSVDYSQVQFPDDFEEKWNAYKVKSAEEYFNETVALLEQQFGPLNDTFDIRYLPENADFFGNMKMQYYYDAPEHSSLHFLPADQESSILMRSIACNCYFNRYLAQQPDVSRAQLISAPETYFSGLGFFYALQLARSEAERTGDYTEWYTLFMMTYQNLMTAYTGCLITLGYDKQMILDDLTGYFGMPEDIAASVYQDARAMPLAANEMAYGYAQLYLLYKMCRTKLAGQMTDRQFIEQYLSYGPSFPNMLNEKMTAWTDEVRN